MFPQTRSPVEHPTSPKLLGVPRSAMFGSSWPWLFTPSDMQRTANLGSCQCPTSRGARYPCSAAPDPRSPADAWAPASGPREDQTTAQPSARLVLVPQTLTRPYFLLLKSTGLSNPPFPLLPVPGACECWIPCASGRWRLDDKRASQKKPDPRKCSSKLRHHRPESCSALSR